jgi:tRNA wybutosine-synthesizing protein 3
MDKFNQRKKEILSKEDKSSIGGWDKPIVPLCEKINSLDNFYTTSSCSGRTVLIVDQSKKAEGLFLKVWHNKVSFEEFRKSLNEIKDKSELIKFKFEQPILHIACRNLDSASKLLENAKHLGFKHSGILTLGKNIILELNGSEKMEFPIVRNSEVLVGDDFLELVIDLSNKKLEKGWDLAEKLKESL